MDENKALAVVFKEAPPSSVDAGAEYALSIFPTWPQGIAPHAATYGVRQGDRTLQQGALPKATEDGSIALTLRAPDEVGEHRLSLAIASAPQEKGARVEGTLPFVLETVPHATSLAVWDTPSPVVRNAPFEIKAGAKCSASCALAGKVIEIRDEAGQLKGSGAVGEAAVPGTTALFFTTISLKAPRKLGLHRWTASFAPSELKLPHDGATSGFSFVAVAEPEHSVSVKVINKETKSPIAGAQVRLGVYRAVTNDSGSAKVHVPRGVFPLVVSRVGYRMPERNVEVAKDVRVRIVAEELPEPDPYALWTA